MTLAGAVRTDCNTQLCPSHYQDERGLFRDDAVWANGKRDYYVMVDHEKHAVTVSDMEIKDLMLVPSHTFKFVAAK